MSDGLYIPETMKAEQMKPIIKRDNKITTEINSQPNHKIEVDLSIDHWETVAEWEERTGLKYPEEGPVWIYDEDHGRSPWKVYELWEYKYFHPATCIVPRIGMGKPPEDL